MSSSLAPARTAVLLSGGLDSAVLLAEEAARGEVHPIYVRVGLAWEAAERCAVDAFLASAAGEWRLRPLKVLTVDMTDVYPAGHWAVQGQPPAYHTPDEDVYLVGRNVVLLGKAGVYCAGAEVDRLVLGTLGDNPFPDATPSFRSAMAAALSLGLARTLQIDAPYAHVSKPEVIRRGAAMGVRMNLTMSCMNPEGKEGREARPSFPRHCGLCSKCRERHEAFVDAGVDDPTDYADRRHLKG
jgi:7-cyano-7-deazaguanine synthase